LQSTYDQANGQFIEIDHGDGYRTKYAHLKSPYVTPRQLIKLGQTIREVGSTGRSTSPHLHYEVIYLGTNINPLNILGKANNPNLLAQDTADTSKTLASQTPNQSSSQSNTNVQRIPFITDSGFTYRMVEVAQLR